MKHYVDNKQFYAALVEHRERRKQAKLEKTPPPRIPEYIGACLYQIATRLSTKPNFINYTYRDEMISDGIENCINYLDNFDPDKSQNPFAYFTQIIYYAFLRRIQKEKKQLYIKHKSLQNHVLESTLSGDTDSIVGLDIDNEYMVEFAKNFEDNLKKKK